MVSKKRVFVHEHKIEGGYVVGTVNFHLNQLEGAGIFKLNDLLVKVGFFKAGKLHGYCMVYKEGIPQSVQLFDDGDLIKDTHHITSIMIAKETELKDDEKGIL